MATPTCYFFIFPTFFFHFSRSPPPRHTYQIIYTAKQSKSFPSNDHTADRTRHSLNGPTAAVPLTSRSVPPEVGTQKFLVLKSNVYLQKTNAFSINKPLPPFFLPRDLRGRAYKATEILVNPLRTVSLSTQSYSPPTLSQEPPFPPRYTHADIFSPLPPSTSLGTYEAGPNDPHESNQPPARRLNDHSATTTIIAE